MEEDATSEQCVELRNIKYKTMLLNGNPLKETKSMEDFSNLDKFLDNERNNNKIEPWCKLDKTSKTKKLLEFANAYKLENELDDDEEECLIAFFKDSLERKKLQRVKDVIYDKETGVVKEIPALTYIRSNRHFTLKNVDKQRVSTIKSLPPKKTHGTIKNKVTKESVTKDKDTI
jgi:hypothetical protein